MDGWGVYVAVWDELTRGGFGPVARAPRVTVSRLVRKFHAIVEALFPVPAKVVSVVT